jgi:hypothetical protein
MWMNPQKSIKREPLILTVMSNSSVKKRFLGKFGKFLAYCERPSNISCGNDSKSGSECWERNMEGAQCSFFFMEEADEDKQNYTD